MSQVTHLWSTRERNKAEKWEDMGASSQSIKLGHYLTKFVCWKGNRRHSDFLSLETYKDPIMEGVQEFPVNLW